MTLTPTRTSRRTPRSATLALALALTNPDPHQDLEEDPALRYPSPSPSPNPDPNQDLEEDPTLRSQINLYKDEAALQAQVRPSGDLGEI